MRLYHVFVDRGPTPYLYFRVRPTRVQARRKADELVGRALTRNGEWLAAD